MEEAENPKKRVSNFKNLNKQQNEKTKCKQQVGFQ